MTCSMRCQKRPSSDSGPPVAPQKVCTGSSLQEGADSKLTNHYNAPDKHKHSRHGAGVQRCNFQQNFKDQFNQSYR